MAFQLVNNLELAPPSELSPQAQSRASIKETGLEVASESTSPSHSRHLETEFSFELPRGFIDLEGVVHQKGIMRLARAMDEITPMRDPRVQENPAYATVIILSRVILRLGSLAEVTPGVIEQIFACDLNYLQLFYREINELEDA